MPRQLITVHPAGLCENVPRFCAKTRRRARDDDAAPGESSTRTNSSPPKSLRSFLGRRWVTSSLERASRAWLASRCRLRRTLRSVAAVAPARPCRAARPRLFVAPTRQSPHSGCLVAVATELRRSPPPRRAAPRRERRALRACLARKERERVFIVHTTLAQRAPHRARSRATHSMLYPSPSSLFALRSSLAEKKKHNT